MNKIVESPDQLETTLTLLEVGECGEEKARRILAVPPAVASTCILVTCPYSASAWQGARFELARNFLYLNICDRGVYKIVWANSSRE